jgi:hypothetical protein
MHQHGIGELAAVREKQVERFEAAPTHRGSQDAAGVRDQVQAERGADIAAGARTEGWGLRLARGDGRRGLGRGLQSCRVYVVSLIHLGYKVRIAVRGEEES